MGEGGESKNHSQPFSCHLKKIIQPFFSPNQEIWTNFDFFNFLLFFVDTLLFFGGGGGVKKFILDF